ncbi:phage major capsid protein [Geodermatophilus chilensis]|uniref:phage major capsid protein n=1 Tax=Geodermatophilus chilensis TaxID=2035835 RepID=UPI000C264E49|nr:Mu-like prophage major head subunit gpT family protein [Geodermatophilus chilensis]
MTTTVIESFGLTESLTMSGTSPLVRRQYSPQRAAAIVEAARLWDRVWTKGDPRAALAVQEALSTSDLFKSATGDVLDRELLARYGDVQTQWASIASRTTVRNFKPKKMVDLLGGRTVLDVVPELSEYPTADYLTAEYQISVRKFGRRFGYSWEASVNDDLDELQQIPGQYATAAALTEERAAFDALFNAVTGAPNAGFFRNHAGDAIPGPDTTPTTLALTSDNLQTAITAVRSRRDPEGNPIPVSGRLLLVVGPAQEIAARRILEATEVRTTVGSRTTLEPNPLRGVVDLVVLERLPGTAWFLIPAPTAARPALAVAFLRGWETPDLRVKADAGNRLGGGPADPADGAFEDDSVYFRVRHVVGAASLDPTHTYASTGAGA